jgi:hypothetical protein
MNKNVCFNYHLNNSIEYFRISGDSGSVYWRWDTQELFTCTYEPVATLSDKQLRSALKERLPLFKQYLAAQDLAERRQLFAQCVSNKHMFPELPSEDGYLLYPQETLKPKQGEVSFAVSYTYNGGTVYRERWYKGYKCQPPIIPDGYRLVDIGVGHEMNSHPPRATYKLERIK